MEIIWRGFCQRFRRCEKRVRKFRRMRQRAGGLRPFPVSHEPARDRDGDGDEGEERGDDERDDEPDLREADLGVGRRRALRRDLRVGLSTFERQDGVRLHLKNNIKCSC